MLDHISLGVTNLERSIAFYDAVLSPLGYVRVWSDNDAAGYGHPGQDDAFAIKHEELGSITLPRRLHVAFAAANRTAVCAFHAASLEHGAADDGRPGFVIDADGYRIEAVYHEPQTTLIEVNEDDCAPGWRGRNRL